MAGEKLDRMIQCNICLTAFEPHSMVRATICKHIFHKACLEEWLKVREYCPLCRCQLNRKYLVLFHRQKKYKESQPLATPSRQVSPSPGGTAHQRLDTLPKNREAPDQRQLFTSKPFCSQETEAPETLDPAFARHMREWNQPPGLGALEEDGVQCS